MKRARRAAFVGLAWSLIFGVPASAEERYAALVVDAETGAVLQEIGPTRRWYPASLTKLMTAYLTFAAIEAKSLSWSEKRIASDHVAAQPDTRLGLAKGDEITIEEALLAVIAQSANDAAVLLAEAMAGSETAFAARMTETAQRLGMTQTVFRNATGLPNDAQTTSARDMALLAQALLRDFPQHYHYFGARSFTYAGRTLSSINGILSSYPGADGLKTGFTCGSGYNLVASVLRDGRRLIGVVLGAANGAERTNLMIGLLNSGFQSAGVNSEPHPMLAGLTPAADDPPPPFRLAAEECALGVGIRDVAGRLPGWGVLFGVFADKTKAQRVIEQARGALRNLAKGGRPAIVRQEMSEIPRFKALLVGLKQQDAVRACLHLRSHDVICVVQSPAVLNNKAPPIR